MAKRWTVDELIEQALIFAIQDREGFADSNHFDDPHGREAADLAKALRAYHAKRYKKVHLTAIERDMASAQTVSIYDMMKGPALKFPGSEKDNG